MSKHKTHFELPATLESEHRVIREKFDRSKGKQSLSDLPYSVDLDPDSITTVEDIALYFDLIDRLRAERKRQKLTQKQVAERIARFKSEVKPGSDPDKEVRIAPDVSALSRLESGENDNPTINSVIAYARALGKRMIWNFEDRGSDPKSEGGDRL